MLSVGLMSGTSMDGIDAALIETDGETQIEDAGHFSIDYDPDFKILLKAAEYAVRRYKGNTALARANYEQALHDYLRDELKHDENNLHTKIQELRAYLPIDYDVIIHFSTALHALAVKKLLAACELEPAQIDVVGYHGQTLFHAPDKKISVIEGDGRQLAELLGITVVNDFRSNDIAHDGQGAPFAPVYHLALAVRDNLIPVVVVNCGGIANITVIRNADVTQLIGYDTGPGNALIDRLVRQRTQGRESLDENGKYGLRGQVREDVLEASYARAIVKDGRNYFSALPPKSLDYNDLTLVPELDALSLEDACATLEAFTADSIINSVDLLPGTMPKHWVLAGGGWNNPVIKRELIQRLGKKYGEGVRVHTADEIQWNNKALEAQIFAYLAVRRLQGKVISVPGTTRVSKPLTGGKVHRVLGSA